MMRTKLLLGVACLISAVAYAQPASVEDAWARATVPGQRATGAFMKIKSANGAKLTGGASPAAGVVEIHEMKLEAGIMKMNAVPGGLDLPAGKTVELRPGSYHVMLMDLKAPLEVGSTLPLTLTFRDAKGVESKLDVKASVAMQPPMSKTGLGDHKP
jgi:copper(I)-binding protein